MASTGEIDSAIEVIRRQLAERPSDPEAQKQLGLLLLQAGRPASAIAALRAARDRSPQDIQLGAILAETLIDLGQADGALALGREMIAAAPRSAGPHLLMGAILRRLGRLEEAMQACRQAVDRAPVQAATLNALGASLLELDRLEEAEPVLRRAVTADPGLAPAARNLGGCLKRLGRPEEAEAAFRAALAGSPDPRSRAELGATLLHQGRFPEARAELEAAIAGDPECVEARIGLAHLTLLLGEYETGLPLLEWRDRLRPAPAPFPQPLWRGEPLAGKTILLHGEQGFGDTIQYLRYVPEIARRAGRVVLVVQGELRRLAAASFPGLLAESSADIAACSLRASLIGLALLCGTRSDTVPKPPYLQADGPAVAAWRARLGEGRKIGLVWGGNQANRNDRMRSLDPRLLAPLAAIPGSRWVSLQLGRADKPDLPGMLDPTAELGDFADTAALLGALDLLVSVETAVAHLCGALARPGLVLLPYLPDWRWHFASETSPWYPSLRLFRQDKDRAWEPVIARVAAALAAG
jgi:tetratricopeptide (TPR) repeat protein